MLILDKVHRLVRLQVRALGGRSVFRVVAGRRLHAYELEGRPGAPTLVLVHGLGASADTWAGLLPKLRRAWGTILVPDLPGFGLSPLEEGETPLDLMGHYQLLSRYLDEVVRLPAALVGNSLGGALALRAAVDRGNDVLGLGLLAPAGAPFEPDELEALRKGYELRTRSDAIALVERMFHRRSRTLRIVAGDLKERFDTPAVQHVLSSANSSSTPTFTAEELAGLSMPTTLAWGASERLLPARGIEFFRSHLPAHARIEVLENCGHVPQMEAADRTAQLLCALARDVSVHSATSPSRKSGPRSTGTSTTVAPAHTSPLSGIGTMS